MEVDNNSVKTEMLNERIRKSPNNICIAVEVCVVCGDRASGRHYGAISCEGCKGFFKRSIRKQLGYQCRGSRSCEVTKHHRNRCQYCRLQKCLASGMRSDSVQHERKPIVVKKELANSIANNNNFNSNNNNPNKIFIRKDLNTEALTRLPAAFNPCEQLGLSFINNRIASNSTSEVIPSYHLSPSQASNDDDLSLDSNNASSTDYMEAVHLARDQKIISKALANVARIQSIQDISADFSQQTSEEAECYNYEAPILQDERHIDFVMHPHRSHLNPVLNDHYSCETASRLLYATVYWVRHFPPFQYLPADIRIAIVQGCWAELFTLALAQRAPDLNMNLIYSTLTGHMQKLIEQGQVSARKIKQVSDHIVNLQEYVGSMRKLNVNEHEYAYLRVLTLFSIDRPDVLLNRHIERIQEKTVHDLIAYAKANHPNEPDRFPKLLLRLLPLRALKSSIIEELFFVNVLGQMEISVCIPYLVTTENDVTTPHFLRAIKSEQPEEFAC